MDDLPVDDELIARATEMKESFERRGIRITLEDSIKAVQAGDAAIRDPAAILRAINRVVEAASEVEVDSGENDSSESKQQ